MFNYFSLNTFSCKFISIYIYICINKLESEHECTDLIMRGNELVFNALIQHYPFHLFYYTFRAVNLKEPDEEIIRDVFLKYRISERILMRSKI